MHVRKKSQAFELTPGQTLLISILEKLNYLRGSIGLCENHRRLTSQCCQIRTKSTPVRSCASRRIDSNLGQADAA